MIDHNQAPAHSCGGSQGLEPTADQCTYEHARQLAHCRPLL